MSETSQDFVLIGAGIMCATLGVFIRRLMPDAQITIFERLDRVAAESSDAWNNAGTGHSAFCELNYTPCVDGGIDISKALQIANDFEISRQLWAWLKQQGHLPNASDFINDIPHMSLVWGEENVAFLRARHQAMSAHPLFRDMLYSEDTAQIQEWTPLIMEGRTTDEPLAATRMDAGTDVNFGQLTRGMIAWLESTPGTHLKLGHEIQDLEQDEGNWKIHVKDLSNDESYSYCADHVFIGAGGATLQLLEKSDIVEARGYGGFPVSGHFLRCTNEAVIKRHAAKVYGKAKVGSPPMSVPHLDTRMINGQRSLFFGPYAGFTTKFLKSGSWFDLPLSIEMHNVWPMLAAGYKNIELTKYLIEQIMQSDEERFAELQVYYPNAVFADWELITAGQRVQIIKKDEGEGGVLKFGTEIVCSEDRTIAALLGASPGASTSVSIMLNVLERLFPGKMLSVEWKTLIRDMIPTYGQSLIGDGKLCLVTRRRTADILDLSS
ncbi:MAG: malate dehydrogenase (quinone) [Gammaproteobacteria bacterium]|nr:malate dehydrogenase (quinone) [Gammaproteobacteria bacterium]